MILFVLLGAVLSLAAVACAAERLPAAPAIVAVCGVCLVAGLVGLARGGSASLPVPLGFPGISTVLAVDRVSLAFVPAVAIAGAATAALGVGLGRLAATLASALLVLCAGDACLLVTGLGCAALASGRPATLGIAALALAASLAPLLPPGLLPQEQWAALRTEAGSSAWGVPFALAACVVVTGADRVLAPLGVFLLVRVVVDLGGPTVPFACGLLVTGVGLACAVERGLRAVRGARLETVVAAMTGLALFLAVAELGMAVAARAADLPAVASASLAGALMLVWLTATAVPLARLGARAVAEQAGSSRLAALGGLAGPMRWTTAAIGVALASLACVPPFAGFVPVWLFAQSLLLAPRFGGLASPIVLALALALLGLAWGLAIAASARLLVVAFGGRPRTPRGAASAEALPEALWPMAALGGLLLCAALFPGALLQLFDPAVSTLAGTALAGRAGWLTVRAVPEGAAWSPLAVVAVVGLAAGAWWWARPEASLERRWDDGATLPEWLPFGEPLAQASAPGLARGVLGALGLREAGWLAERAGLEDRSAGPAARDLVASGWRIGRRLARLARRCDEGLLGAGPLVLAAIVAAVLLAAVLLAPALRGAAPPGAVPGGGPLG